MLGRFPRPYLRQSTSKGELHSTQSHEFVFFPSSEDEKPVLLPPHQIVIGFEVASDNSKSFQAQASESPRSVLEHDNLCFRVHQQQAQSPRSPLSVLGSLLSGQPGKRACAEGVASCLKVAADTQEVSNAANAQTAYSKQGLATGKADGESSLKTEHIPCDVHRNIGIIESKRDTYAKVDHVAASTTQSWNHGRNEHVFSGVPRHKRFQSRADDDDDSKDGDGFSNGHISLFSMASPLLDYSRYSRPEVDFLSKCFLCRRHLVQGKDIYMYRGDRAFCSQECRHSQIVVDERRESRPVSMACVSRASAHRQRAQRASQAAVAT